MTFVLVGLWRSGNYSPRNELTKNVKDLALQALFPLRRGLRLARELLRKFRSPGLPPLLLPVRLPLLPLDLGLARGVEVPLDVRLLRASAPLSLQLLRELQRGRLLGSSGLPLPMSLPRLLLPTHRSTFRDMMS